MFILGLFDPAVLLALKIALIAIVADTLITWCLTFVQGTFDIRKVPQFLKTNVLPYFGALVILAVVTIYAPDYTPIFYFVTGLVTIKFGVEAIKDKLTKFFTPTTE